MVRSRFVLILWDLGAFSDLWIDARESMVARFPSFGGIKALYALVETGRVKDAADLLGVSASAISIR